jgi:hypothetical protein
MFTELLPGNELIKSVTVLWDVDALLDNDSEINDYTAAVTR